jgi:hypothetical protein
MVEVESFSGAIYGFAGHTSVLEVRISIREAATLRLPLRGRELALTGGV